MMRQMRENTKWIMLITASAFVALMVFEWGMDASGRSGGAGDIGQVGRTTVSVQQYQDVYRNLYQQVQNSQEGSITSQQNREIEDMAWDQVVDQILIQSELERRGIRVSDEEILDAVRYVPPPGLRSDPAFQTDGRFDPQKYQQWLSSVSQDPVVMQQLEQYYRELIPRNKLMRQIRSGVYISDRELWEEWKDRNEQVEASVLTLRADERIPDGAVEVGRDEIEAYYRDNREDFAVPAQADIRYVSLARAPTPADSAAVRERAEEIHQELLDGADFAELADVESADRASAAEGGSLGTIQPGDMPAAFSEAAFSRPVGEVGEPVRTSRGWHIMEVVSRDDEEETAEVRHILLPIERTDDSEIRLLTRADSLEALGRDHTVEEAARELGLTVREGTLTEDLAILPAVGRAEEGQSWIFEDGEGPGAVSPVFENEEAFYMLEIVNERPSGYLALDEVADEIEADLRLEKKVALAMEQAEEIAAEIRAGTTTLEEVGEREGLEVRSTDPFTREEFVPGLGTRNAAVGAAFGVAEGEVAGPVRVDDRVVVLRVDDKIEADRETWEAQKEMQRAQLTAQRQQQRLDQWLEGLRETVTIHDQRAEFFRQAEEQEAAPPGPSMGF